MKRLRFAVAPAVALFALVSCLSTPSVPADPGKSPESAVQATPSDSVPQEDTDARDTELDQTDSSMSAAAPVGETSPEADESVQVESMEPLSALEPTDDGEPPMLPPSERLLYFYPEPDPSFAAPPEPASPKPETAVKPQPPVKEPSASPEKAGVKNAAAGAVKPAAREPVAEKAKAEVLPGIWEAEPTTPSIPPEKASAVPSVPRQPPSRQIAIPAGQTLEVWYPGSGWVFLGDASSQNGLGYENRKLDKTDTLFTFKALKPGNYILDFSRFDVLEDSFLQDSLAVTVSEQGTARTARVRAPDYRASGKKAETNPSSVNPSLSSAQSGTLNRSLVTDEPGLSVPAVSQSENVSRETVPQAQEPAEILKKAETALASGDPQAALILLDGFFAAAVTSLDEGWFLRGRAYESNGPTRDVRKALEAYQTLVQAFPDSIRWKEADERIRYIRQFYQKIR